MGRLGIRRRRRGMDGTKANDAGFGAARAAVAETRGPVAEPRMPCVTAMMRRAGLRPTRQRLALGGLLFGKGHRHVSAETLFEEALLARMPVSLATVYNTLHQFTEAGLLRELAVDGSKSYFDTNTGDHHHFFVEADNVMMDIPAASVSIDALPEVPDGMEIVRVDVVVRLRKKA